MTHKDLDALKNEAKRRIHSLVEDYMQVLATGKKDAFNEERVKIAFMVPMLEALGWNPRTDEVLPEQATLTGRADFGLRVGGRTRIFVEMKSFSKSLDGHERVKGRPRSYPEQAIQYAWGMKADWAVLTNFEETRLYDSHVRRPEDGLVWKRPIRFTEYESRFDELWLISKESVVSGALDAYKAKVERPPVDEAFLGDLMNCRQLLAEDLKTSNPGLTYDQINESVQKILDRLIFIKNCEDRLIIPAESLWKRFKGWQETSIDANIVTFMMDLKNLFRYFDQVYNGKLFEKHFCEDLKISNSVLEEIINVLYGDGRHLGYDFSVIPVDVLGQTYELYIGSVIREKEGQAKAIEIVRKSSKRRALGIYYTPEYAVAFIVRNTLGTLVNRCKTAEDVSKIKVLDCACGSGSFLIKAFDIIREWYVNYDKQYERIVTPGTLDAHLELIPNAEERILTENLYGVDLDPQAVEITILNLSLKAVKTREKLPYMGDHVKCGNSLIFGSEQKIRKFFDEKWKERKPFNWKEEFPEVLHKFDVFIGNPPYINLYKFPKEFRNYLQFRDNEIFTPKNDVLYHFYKRGLDLLKEGGFLGYITSRYFLEATNATKFRKFLLENACIDTLIDFGNVEVFEGINTRVVIMILIKDTAGKSEGRHSNKIKVVKVKKWPFQKHELMEHIKRYMGLEDYHDDYISAFKVDQKELSSEPWRLLCPCEKELKRQIECDAWHLGGKDGLCKIGMGMQTGLDEAFRVTTKEIEEEKLERRLIRKLVRNGDIRKYYIRERDEYWIYTENIDIDNYPNIKKHLMKYYDKLIERYPCRGPTPKRKWYEYTVPNLREVFEKNTKILVPYKAPCNRFALDDRKCLSSMDVYVACPKESCPMSITYILALLNSDLLDYAYITFYGRRKKAEFDYYTTLISKIPIKKPPNKVVYVDLEKLATELTFLHKVRQKMIYLFNQLVNSQPYQLNSFRVYYDHGLLYGFSAKRVLIDPKTGGIVFNVGLEETDENIVLEAEYAQNGHRKRAKVLDCKIPNKYVRRFLTNSIKLFIETRRSKKILGKGKILKVLLENIQVPRFYDNHEENLNLINLTMEEFFRSSPGEESISEIERKIWANDDKINEIVLDLYALDDKKKEMIRRLYKVRTVSAYIERLEQYIGVEDFGNSFH